MCYKTVAVGSKSFSQGSFYPWKDEHFPQEVTRVDGNCHIENQLDISDHNILFPDDQYLSNPFIVSAQPTNWNYFTG